MLPVYFFKKVRLNVPRLPPRIHDVSHLHSRLDVPSLQTRLQLLNDLDQRALEVSINSDRQAAFE